LDIYFKSTKLEKEFNEGKRIEKAHGSLRAKKIRLRLNELRATSSLYDLGPPKSGPGRCHELTGERKGQLSVDLDHPYRLIFVPYHNPVPLKKDGGLDWKQVTAIMVVGIEDTHE
jgi:plasmid maintenance system killer protein